MVKVQVRIDDNVNIVGLQPQLAEFTGKSAGVIDAVDVAELLAKLISDARFHQNVVASRLDHQAGQAEADAIAGVGRDSFLPQRLGDNREHLPTIKLESPVGNSVKVESA